jgi:hypothetical protein
MEHVRDNPGTSISLDLAVTLVAIPLRFGRVPSCRSYSLSHFEAKKILIHLGLYTKPKQNHLMEFLSTSSLANELNVPANPKKLLKYGIKVY